MSRRFVLVLGTGNPGKLAEVRRVLHGHGIRVIPARGMGDPPEIGTTYAANARIKAVAAMTHSGKPAIGDDSGLEVQALGGRPGLHSARYAPTAQARIAKLLRAIRGCANRRARFVCVVALAHPRLGIRVFRGTVAGRIGEVPQGTGGFGYDPVFFPSARAARGAQGPLTMAQISAGLKDRISHRGRALARMLAWLVENPQWAEARTTRTRS